MGKSFFRRLGNRTLFTFKGGEMAAYVVRIRKHDMTIATTSGDMRLRFVAGHRMYALFAYLASKNAVKEICAMCVILYTTLVVIAADTDSMKGIMALSYEYIKSGMAKGEKKAGEADGFENDTALRDVKINVMRGEEMAGKKRKREEIRDTLKNLRNARGASTPPLDDDKKGTETAGKNKAVDSSSPDSAPPQ